METVKSRSADHRVIVRSLDQPWVKRGLWAASCPLGLIVRSVTTFGNNIFLKTCNCVESWKPTVAVECVFSNSAALTSVYAGRRASCGMTDRREPSPSVPRDSCHFENIHCVFCILIHAPFMFYYFVLWPANAQLSYKLSHIGDITYIHPYNKVHIYYKLYIWPPHILT
jgi:hypothetical protein